MSKKERTTKKSNSYTMDLISCHLYKPGFEIKKKEGMSKRRKKDKGVRYRSASQILPIDNK